MFGQTQDLSDEERERMRSMDIDAFTIVLFRWFKANLNTWDTWNLYSFKGIGRYLFPVSGGDIAEEDRVKIAEAIANLERKGLVVKVYDDAGRVCRICLSSIGIKSHVDNDVLLLVDKPEEIVSALEQQISGLDDVVREYYLESLRAYQEELYFSSVICLGAASERAVHWLTEAIETNWGQYQTEIRKKRDGSIAKLIEYLINDVIPNVFSRDKRFARELVKRLEHLADVYRENRNEAGHPTTLEQSWLSEDQEILLLHFRRYITTITKAVTKSGTTPTT